jgi:polyphosphate:AMP phosphotransferase
VARGRLQRVLQERRTDVAGAAPARRELKDHLLDALFDLRERKTHAVVMVVTGIPTAGRSEVVNELLSWLDPKQVDVYGFRACSEEELAHPPLWRYWRILPPKGRIAILHGGWHQDLLQQAVARGDRKQPSPARWRRAAGRIVQLERMLVQDGIAIEKVHLHVSESTQRERLDALAGAKATRWRVTREDRWLSRHYADVERALEREIEATEHTAAPWHLVDGTDEQRRVEDVARRLLHALSNGPARVVASADGPRVAVRRPRKIKTPTAGTAASPPDDDHYESELERLQGRLARLTRRKRFADHAVVAVFEGMDAAGKGGAIRRVVAALDARQYRVVPISAPSPEEGARPYLWRFWSRLPPRGNLTIFDRSWYGRVLVERVRKLAADPDWRRAYDEIVEFERQLDEHGLIVAKFWLAVSRDEQLARFEERDRNPLKRHKVDPEDWVNREHWPQYQRAAEEMIERTDTRHGPWTVIAADDKRQARLRVLGALVDRIDAALD